MRQLLRTFTLARAYSVKFALDSAGIESVVQGQQLSGILGDAFSVWVVHDEDLEPARAVVEEFEQA